MPFPAGAHTVGQRHEENGIEHECMIAGTPGSWRMVSVFTDVITGSALGLGKFDHCLPDVVLGRYECDGSTYTDAKLAAYITANPVTGFSVAGDDVTTADYRGRALMSGGLLGIPATPGTTFNDATALNGLRGEVLTRNDGGATGTGYRRDMLANQLIRSTNSFMGSVRVNYYSQDAETRPHGVSMPICIQGTAPGTIEITNAITAAGQTLTANADGTATWV